MISFEPRGGLIGVPSENGLALPEDVTLEEWGRLIRTLDILVASSSWFLVDAMAYGEYKWGESCAQMLPGPDEDPLGASQARMKQAAWMGRVYPSGTRVPGASYTHHRIVADLPPTDRRAMLAEVADAAGSDKPISTRELGRRVKARQDRLAGTAQTIDGEVIDSDVLIWAPDESDLTDEARAAMEQHAPLGRLRVAYVTGWLRAMVWADQQDAFRPGRWQV